MSCGTKGGYSKVVYGTTTGLSTSTEITPLLQGTLISEGESLTVDDSAGRQISTGFRQGGEVRTSALTAAFITNLIAAQNNCTELYFRYYTPGAGRIKVGPVRVTVRFAGAEVGGLHQFIIAWTGFDEDALDIITVEAQ